MAASYFGWPSFDGTFEDAVKALEERAMKNRKETGSYCPGPTLHVVEIAGNSGEKHVFGPAVAQVEGPRIGRQHMADTGGTWTVTRTARIGSLTPTAVEKNGGPVLVQD